MIFTEIDHNYVDPPSYSNKLLIDELLKNRSEWVNDKISGATAYPTPIKIFNEYMTYGVFILYCRANYDADSFKIACEQANALMKERGFFRMKVFGDTLLKVQSENATLKIDLYPIFLKALK